MTDAPNLLFLQNSHVRLSVDYTALRQRVVPSSDPCRFVTPQKIESQLGSRQSLTIIQSTFVISTLPPGDMSSSARLDSHDPITQMEPAFLFETFRGS